MLRVVSCVMRSHMLKKSFGAGTKQCVVRTPAFSFGF